MTGKILTRLLAGTVFCALPTGAWADATPECNVGAGAELD